MRILLLGLLATLLAQQQQPNQPINALCPVKPKQKSRPTITVVYEGQVIGFC